MVCVWPMVEAYLGWLPYLALHTSARRCKPTYESIQGPLRPLALCGLHFRLLPFSTLVQLLNASALRKLRRFDPEIVPPPMLPLGGILQRLVLQVTRPVLELDQMNMEFPGFIGDVFATARITGRHQEHSTSRQQTLRDLDFADDSTPMMTECSGGARASAYGRSTAMYQPDERAQAAAAVLTWGLPRGLAGILGQRRPCFPPFPSLRHQKVLMRNG